ncbi:hypothetical protein Salat_2533900 [Sesamum alatum]|uniref:Uncharacterized protein n=1 Tax=Sesamum alatum TaxID=300844 RepID=A0AAE1XS38_9LAMI|nr:hypothetical protein Salat_2533900 [Sesamum alatum]
MSDIGGRIIGSRGHQKRPNQVAASKVGPGPPDPVLCGGGVVQQLSITDQPRFLMICWALWQTRNKKMMEQLQQDPLQIVRTDQFLVNYIQACARMRVGGEGPVT